ncbi:MAG: TRAP transporter substrate-binding protein [Saprospiraceae bacterium]|nr:TRAP transporter substrate-binding protein [Saprospiraceae bacterium]
MKRDVFLKTGAVLGLGTLAAGCSSGTEAKSENKKVKTKYNWKMVTTWPPNFPVLGEGCKLFSDWVFAMSGGEMAIKIYGSGELIPALECFDAVSSGAAEMASGAAYYWAGKNEAFPFFTSIPFGMNAQQMNAWLYSGGGHTLWKELYANYNIIPFPAGNTGMQMAGWFNKEINSIDDFKGLKMRIPGLGGKVLDKAGGTPVLSGGSEIYTNLERGVIDATEWIGPYHDYVMGFHKIAKYYYAPGWHETGSTLELLVNKREMDNLPEHLKVIIETAAARFNVWCLSEFESKNNTYLKKIIEEEKVEIRTFSKETLSALQKISSEVMEELGNKNEVNKKIYTSYMEFMTGVRNWSKYSEKLYYNDISL